MDTPETRTQTEGTHATNIEAVIAHFTPLYGLTVPNENVLTFRRWQERGRCVRQGEKGFGIFVYSGGRDSDPEPDPEKARAGKAERRPRGRWVRVFHEAQTELCTEDSPREDPDRTPLPSQPPIPQAARESARTARESARTARAARPAPAERGMTEKQIQHVEACIARADRTSGRLAWSTSTAKRWRDTLGTMRDALRTIRARPDLTERLQQAIATVAAFEHVQPGSTGLDYFPTGPTLAADMWAMARQHLQRPPALLEVLEPSAGDGALVVAPLADGANVYAVERSWVLRECLRAQFARSPSFALSEAADYLAADAVPEGMTFDAVLMNPPFERGASAEHLRRAYTDHLAPGGIVIAIVGEGCFSGGDRRYVPWFEGWLEDVGAEVEECPAGSFEGTSARARRVTIIK